MSKAWVRDGEGKLSLELMSPDDVSHPCPSQMPLVSVAAHLHGSKAWNKKPPSDNMLLVERRRNRTNVFRLLKHLLNQIDIIIYPKTVPAAVI